MHTHGVLARCGTGCTKSAQLFLQSILHAIWQMGPIFSYVDCILSYIYIYTVHDRTVFFHTITLYIYNISIYLSLGFATQISEKLEVFEYFGTTARVMLTMFELTLAYLGVGVAREPVDIWCSKVLGFSGRYWPWWLRNWPVAARILQENVTDAKLQGALKMAGIRGWHNGVPCFLLTSSRV